MATIEELVDGPRFYNRIGSIGTDGQMLVAERITHDDPTSAWKLIKTDTNGQLIRNDPPFAEAYTKNELFTLAKFGSYIDWKPSAIDFTPGSRLVDGEGYRDEIMPKY